MTASSFDAYAELFRRCSGLVEMVRDERERVILIVGRFVTDLEMGGLSGFLYNISPDSPSSQNVWSEVREVVVALRRIEAAKTARCARAAHPATRGARPRRPDLGHPCSRLGASTSTPTRRGWSRTGSFGTTSTDSSGATRREPNGDLMGFFYSVRGWLEGNDEHVDQIRPSLPTMSTGIPAPSLCVLFSDRGGGYSRFVFFGCTVRDVSLPEVRAQVSAD